MNTENSKRNTVRWKICFVLNILIIIFTIIGMYYMFLTDKDGGALTSKGIYNLKYFTVLSNIFCGGVAVAKLVSDIKGKTLSLIWKLLAATEVGVTFAVVAFFLQPAYPDMDMYKGGNLYYHLLEPLVAMTEFVILKTISERIPFKKTFLAMIPTAVYGLIYTGNIIVNGKGEWPDTNDFYGFLNWGYGFGALIFAGNVTVSWITSLILLHFDKLIILKVPGSRGRNM